MDFGHSIYRENSVQRCKIANNTVKKDPWDQMDRIEKNVKKKTAAFWCFCWHSTEELLGKTPLSFFFLNLQYPNTHENEYIFVMLM